MGRALLLIVCGLVIIFGMDQLNMTHRQNMMIDRSSVYASKEQSRNIASSLVDLAITQLNNDITWRTGLTESNYLGGNGTVKVYDQSNDNALGPYDLLLVSDGHYLQQNSEITVLMRRTSYSKYAYFTNTEPSNIYFVSGDSLKGPVHTNGTIHVNGDPVFEGQVTSPNQWSGSGSPKFLGGYNFSSSTVQLPTNFTALDNMASNGGLQFSNSIKVQFNSDGTVDVSQQQKTWGGWTVGYVYSWSTPQSYTLSNYNGVITSSQNVYVQGDLNGQVTIHSKGNIHITGDLTYADNPLTDPNSTDMLGLVSNNNVIVDDGAESVNGTEDLTIQASILASNSFYVQDYNNTYIGTRGNLHLLGGIIQNTRGPVGTFTSYGGSITNVSGYSKRYEYDNRLMSRWPPGYPLEDSYSIVSWKE